MAVVVEELLVTLRADMDQYNLRVESTRRDTDRRLSQMEQSFARFERNLSNSSSRAALGVRNAMAGLGAALTVEQLASYADGWLQVQRALEGTEKVFGVAVRSASDLADMAIRTRSDLSATVALYTKMSIAAQRLGYDEQFAADATETFSKALKLGQAAASEQASAIRQFSQALQSGVLRGDEFNSIMENAGVVVEALARRFGVGTGELRQMAEEGKILARDMVEALRDVRPAVDEAFAAAPATLAESVTNLNTALTEYIGKVGESTGVSQALAGGIQSIANNLDSIGKALVAIAGGLAVVFAGPLFSAVGAVVGGVGSAAVALGSLEAAATAGLAVFTSGVVGARVFGDELLLVADKGITMTDVFTLFQKEVFSSTDAAGAFESGWRKAIDNVTGALRDGSGATSDLLEDLRSLVNLTVGLFHAAAKVIVATFYAIPNAVGEALIDFLNLGIQKLREFVSVVASVANQIPGVKMGELQIEDFENPLRGFSTRARELMQGAGRDLGRDFVGEWSKQLDGMGDALTDKLAAIAQSREAREWITGTKVTKAAAPAPASTTGTGKLNAYEKEVEQIQKRTDALLAEAAAVGKSALESERAAAMAELLADAKKAGLEVTPALLAQMDQLSRAYAVAAAELAFLQSLQRQRDENESLRREIDLTGLWGFELHRARVEAELLAEARRQGVELTDAKRKAIADTAAETAATQALREALDEVRNTAQDVLKGYIADLREGKSATEALGNALNRIADKLLDMAANQLVEAALGGLLKSGGGAGGVVGGALSLFGFAGGGVMTPGGPRQLQRFASGGVSTKAAIFGEAGPEAAVPLPDGRRIPVELRVPNVNEAAIRATSGLQQAVSVHVAPVINLQPGVTAEDLARVKAEIAAEVPKAVRHGLTNAFDRSSRFARSKV